MPRSHWLIALTLSLLLHAAFIVSIEAKSDSGSGLINATGDQGLEVGLGKIGAYKDQLQLLAKTTSTSTDTDTDTDTDTKSLADEIESELKQEPKIHTSTPVETAKPTPKKPQKILVKVAEKKPPEIKSEPNLTPKPKQHAPSPGQTQENTNGDAKVSKQAMEKSTGKNNTRPGGKKGNSKDFSRQLMAWLNQHKVYPAELKKQKKQGVVVVKFTVQKNGELNHTSIQTSSGIDRLDRAALEMLANANPVPPIPDSLNRQHLVIALPVRYTLDTK